MECFSTVMEYEYSVTVVHRIFIFHGSRYFLSQNCKGSLAATF